MKRYVALLVGFVAALVMAAPASASLSDVPTPTVTGPVPVTADSTPWAATDQPLGDYGYVEEEFKYAADAFSYDTTGAIDQTGTKITTGGPANDGAYPFKTRMIVRRPTDPADFNGTVVVEWQNVTATFDLEANWYGDPAVPARQRLRVRRDLGSARRRQLAPQLGCRPLRRPRRQRSRRRRRRDGHRRRPLLRHLRAGIKALLDGGSGADPLGPLATPDTVIATGESQSGGRLNTYYNKVQPIHDIVDAFLLTVSTRHDPRRRPAADDPGAQREREPDPADRARRRRTTASGRSPVDRTCRGWRSTTSRADRARSRNHPLGDSSSTRSRGSSGRSWSTRPTSTSSLGERRAAPPIAPRGEYDPSPPGATDQLDRDELGIAEGGIRLPEMTVPVRLNTGVNATGPGGGIFSAFCRLLGSTEDLPDSVLLSRYDDWADYVAQVEGEGPGGRRGRLPPRPGRPATCSPAQAGLHAAADQARAERQEEAERQQVQARMEGQHRAGHDLQARALRRRRRDLERRQGGQGARQAEGQGRREAGHLDLQGQLDHDRPGRCSPAELHGDDALLEALDQGEGHPLIASVATGAHGEAPVDPTPALPDIVASE